MTDCGEFLDHLAYMKEQIESYGFTAIDGFPLVPKDASMYSPDLLHPVDVGFVHYANNLVKFIK